MTQDIESLAKRLGEAIAFDPPVLRRMCKEAAAALCAQQADVARLRGDLIAAQMVIRELRAQLSASPAMTPEQRAAILAAVQAVYDAGKDARSKEIGPYMKVDPAAMVPQSGSIIVDRRGNNKTTFRSAKP